MTKSRVAAVFLIVLGIVALVASTVVPALLPTEAFWSQQQAEEKAIAASRLHQITHEAGHIQDSKTASQAEKQRAQRELAEAKARYQQSQSALDRAQFWRDTVPMALRWSAAGLSAVGLLIYLSAAGDKH
jgi:hypothetical protein